MVGVALGAIIYNVIFHCFPVYFRFRSGRNFLQLDQSGIVRLHKAPFHPQQYNTAEQEQTQSEKSESYFHSFFVLRKFI